MNIRNIKLDCSRSSIIRLIYIDLDLDNQVLKGNESDGTGNFKVNVRFYSSEKIEEADAEKVKRRYD